MEKITTIQQYSQMIDEFAWYGQGDVFAIARAARRLNRDYMQDITERKLAILDARREEAAGDGTETEN